MKHIHANYYVTSDEKNIILVVKKYNEKKQEEYLVNDSYYKNIEHLIRSLTDRKIYDLLEQDNIIDKMQEFKNDILKYVKEN